MNTTHIHLLLNHVAILGALFSVILLLAGMFIKSDILQKTALLGFVLAALASIPVFLTGEPAEESVEHLPGIVEATIHEHEESAEFSIWAIEALGAFSLLGFIMMFRGSSIKSGFMGLVLILSLIAAGSISYTGYLGGKIRHTELSPTSGVPVNSGGEAEEEDD